MIDGDYNFRIRAFNGDGIGSEYPLSLTIVIKKPIWKQWWFYVIIFIIAVSLVVAYIRRREYNLVKEKEQLEMKVKERTAEVSRKNEELEIQRDAILAQRDLIRNKNKNITDSIVYASRIQSAILPPEYLLEGLLAHSFVIYLPKDIVSGDYYWIAQKHDKIIVTVADCTGHGVPGAFMSMLGISFLNDIVIDQGIVKSNEILNQLRERVILSLRQTGDEGSTSDGMDISICVIDQKKGSLDFSGAFNPLILIRDDEFRKFDANRMPIGIYYLGKAPFTSEIIKYKKGDMFYLFSDGYCDQFKGGRGKKFSKKRFYDLLIEIHKKPMAEQKKILEDSLNEWMDGGEQIDDITVMGIRM
jgi:serine phosphatase RsbU (regulator of sigma subunit)